MSPAVKHNNMLIKRNKILASIATPQTKKQISEATGLKESYVNQQLLEMYYDNRLEIMKPLSKKRKDPYIYLATGKPYQLLFDKPKEYDYPKLTPLYFVKAQTTKGRDVRLENYEDKYRASQAMRNQQRVKQNVWIASSAAML